MRRRIILLACAGLAVAAPSAQAHVVQPGESLWSVASANGITAATLAAANGLGAESQLIAGTTINVPGGSVVSSQSGGRVVQPGESLWSIASANGLSVASLAAANGLSPTAQLIAGTRIAVAGTTTSVNTAGTRPTPTAERVSAQQVGDIAQSYGMSRSFVQAVGWQESGFNNAALSPANARGVMQIIPPTWNFINRNLAGGTLNPASAHDNVAAGVLYLRHLYRLKGGSRDATIASYYQGPGRQYLLPETQRYVSSVLSFKNWYERNPK
ncbi:MAG: lytic transglycosylase domain-containing protein [Solirubrobacterales bacterium]